VTKPWGFIEVFAAGVYIKRPDHLTGAGVLSPLNVLFPQPGERGRCSFALGQEVLREFFLPAL
jgi:hypothetical protein